MNHTFVGKERKMNRCVKIARIQKNISQKELCKSIGIGVNSLVKLEKGDFSTLKYPVMIRLANALDKTPVELFFSEEE